jgi:hypothetical protein
MRLTYLASPYSHHDKQIQERRFQAACWQAALMLQAGKLVFSPIAHTHPIAAYGLPGDWSFWQAYDRAMLERCNELAVLQLDGWEESIGVQAEIIIAKELNLPVQFIAPKICPGVFTSRQCRGK